MTAKFDVKKVIRPSARWGAREAFSDARYALALAWGLPVAVLVVGTPIALAITAVLEVIRMARGAF